MPWCLGAEEFLSFKTGLSHSIYKVMVNSALFVKSTLLTALVYPCSIL